MSEHEHSSDGETFESFLDSEGIKDEVYGIAIKRTIVWESEHHRKDLATSDGQGV